MRLFRLQTAGLSGYTPQVKRPRDPQEAPADVLLPPVDANAETSLVTFSEPHSGQVTLSVPEKTNSSNDFPHCWHLNSWSGIGLLSFI